MTYSYNTYGTCSVRIDFDMDEDDRVTNIAFTGGCNGNLKAISKLVDGWTAEEIADKLLGNTCGPRSTSCADQLARAVMLAAGEIRPCRNSERIITLIRLTAMVKTARKRSFRRLSILA